MGRRNSGEGSLYQRKDGYWVAQYDGKYRYSKDKKVAQKKLLKLITESEEVQPDKISLEKYLDRWFDFAKSNLKPRSVKRYREAIEVHLKPSLGKTKLQDLEALQIEEMYARKLKESISPSTIQLIHSVLSSSLKRAIRWKLIKHNICKDVDTPRIRRKEIKPFTPQQVRAIISASKYDRLEALWVLAFTTGMRSAELLGLQYDQIDFERETLTVNRTVYNGVEGTPKSKESYRTIKLSRTALHSLKRHRDKNSEGDGFLFTSTAGTPIWSYSFITYYWKPLLERAGIPYQNFHTTRHTCASILLSQGVPITTVSRLLGHKDSSITLRVYSKFIPGMDGKAADAMDSLLEEDHE